MTLRPDDHGHSPFFPGRNGARHRRLGYGNRLPEPLIRLLLARLAAGDLQIVVEEGQVPRLEPTLPRMTLFRTADHPQHEVFDCWAESNW